MLESNRVVWPHSKFWTQGALPEPSKGQADVDIQIESRIEQGDCANLNCGSVNGGDNFTDPLTATHGIFCKKCNEKYD